MKGKTVEWKAEYRVGIIDIDEQHQAIAQFISSIIREVTQQDGWSDIHLHLVNLTALVQTHFNQEEGLMRNHDYPHLEEHATDHKQYSAELKTLQERSPAPDVLLDTIHSLHDGWFEHIQKHDKPFAFHVLKRMALGKS